MSAGSWPKVAGLVVLSLVVGVAVGRFLLPPTIEIRREEIITTKEVARTRQIVYQNKDTARTRVTKRVVTPTKDGPVINETVTESERILETKDTDTTVDATKDTATTRLDSTKVDSRPNWRIGALVGTTIPQPSLLYGAQVERRLLGPVWLGVWGIKKPTEVLAGASLTLEF